MAKGKIMDRRLKLLEKLKTTKLNKLTVKQSGVDVKLNLKKDLADPNVTIDDKVLDMLEKYVSTSSSNGNGSGDKQSSAVVSKFPAAPSVAGSKPQEEAEQPRDETNVNDKASIIQTLTASPSPTKRVHFDVVNASDKLSCAPLGKEISDNNQISPTKVMMRLFYSV